MKRILTLCMALALAGALVGAGDPKDAILRADRVKPKALAAALAKKGKASAKPVLIHIGFKELYRQGHIPGSVYAGPASEPEGLKALRAAAQGIARDKALVIYCGCCPWGDCPNVLPAYLALKEMGFKRLQVMEIGSNFGEEWADKGYPVAMGNE